MGRTLGPLHCVTRNLTRNKRIEPSGAPAARVPAVSVPDAVVRPPPHFCLWEALTAARQPHGISWPSVIVEGSDGPGLSPSWLPPLLWFLLMAASVVLAATSLTPALVGTFI